MSKTKELAGWWWFESKRQEPVLRINSKLRCVSFENGPLHVRQQYLFSTTTSAIFCGHRRARLLSQ